MKKLVAIIMGSDSDLPIMKGACETLDEFNIPYHIEVVSAHRTPQRMLTFAKQAQGKGFKVIIAGAGGAAHLPGMVASATTLPVIGVPVKLKNLNGLDSLLSIVQMPKGVPVATMAIDNSTNAGLLAARIVGTSQKPMVKKLETYQKKMKAKVSKANKNLSKRLLEN